MMNTFLKEEKGSVIIIVALAMVVLIGFVALALDGGYLFYRHMRLQDTADAAALAAGIEMAKSNGSRAEGIAKALEYVEKNGLIVENANGNTAGLTYNDNEHGTITISFPDSNKVKVELDIFNVKLFLARVLGINETPLTASATAKFGMAIEVMGDILPVGFFWGTYETNTSYKLSLAPGQGVSGNYGYLDYKPSDKFNDYMSDGYDGILEVNQDVLTMTGVKVGQIDQAIKSRINKCNEGCSYNNVSLDCPRLVIIPIVDNFYTSNGKSYLTIKGFATFFIEEYDWKSKGKELTGYFINKVIGSKVGGPPSEFMVQAVSLVE